MAQTALTIPSSLSEVKRRLLDAERTKLALKRVREKGTEMTGTLLQTAAVSMAALVMGGIHGRFGEIAPAGIPLSLGAGILLHVAGWAGLAGKTSKDRYGVANGVHGLADGCLAAYLTTLGVSIGTNLRKKALGGSTTSGMGGDIPGGPRAGGGVLNDAEMDRAARAA